MDHTLSLTALGVELEAKVFFFADSGINRNVLAEGAG